MSYLLGIDIGTSSVKTVVVEAESAQILASAAREYPIQQPQPGYAEQDPDDWCRAASQTIRQAVAQSGIDPDALRGIGLCGQMHGFVCLDAQTQPIRSAIIWADTRSAPQVSWLMQQAESYRAYAPGAPAAGFMAATLMWLQEHEPDTLARTHAVILPKDYVRLMLTGEVVTDASDAAATWLFDVAEVNWSQTLINLCGLETRYLPPVLASTDIAGTLSPTAAAELGLPTGIPVITGSADQPAQAIGHGLYAPGAALATIATGGQVVYPMDTPITDPQMRFHVFNHALPGQWYALAAMLAGGLSLRWLRDMFGLTERAHAYEQLSALAADVPPGAQGLMFLPYLAGERTPLMDAHATGAFIGLRLHHGAAHLARAVMEGVAFAMADCLDLVCGLNVADSLRVIASGGGATSPVWRQIQADAYGVPLLLAQGKDHAPFGAALLAGIGCGVYETAANACSRLPHSDVVIEPDKANSAFYAERRDIFRRLYANLKDDMHILSAE